MIFIAYERFKNSNILFYAIQNAYRNNTYLKFKYFLWQIILEIIFVLEYELNCIRNNKAVKKISNIKPIGSQE